MIHLLLDCMGGDHSPDAHLAGAVRALGRFPDLLLTLTGPEDQIRSGLEPYAYDRERVCIADAPDVITGEDKPTDAIRMKRNSSMMVAVDLLRGDDSYDGIVSTGATGALVAAATLRIGRLKGVRRPAFCPVMPTMDGGIVGICDSGANVECSPHMLLQFALMASAYLRIVYGKENPRIGLLNVGTEAEKGDDLRKKVYPVLSDVFGDAFSGNMESRELLTGKYDLIVCDGFSGNVLVKATEGTALQLLKKIKTDIYSKGVYKLGALFMKKMFAEEKEFMNYQNYGGSVLLGIDRTVVKGHGSSDANAIEKCIEQAYTMVKGNLAQQITDSVAALAESHPEILDN